MLKMKLCIVNIALSQLCHVRVGAHPHSHGPELAVSCRHSSVIWPFHIQPLSSLHLGRHQINKIGEELLLNVEYRIVEHKISQLQVQHANHYTTKPQCLTMSKNISHTQIWPALY